MTPTLKEGPPTLRDLRDKASTLLDQFVALADRVTAEGPEIQKKIFSSPTISERAGAAGQLITVLAHFTDEALELDEKRRAPLENLPQTTCAHCEKPYKGMWLECGNCFRIRATLDELLEMARLVSGAARSNGLFDGTGPNVQKMYLDLEKSIAKVDALAPTPKEEA